MVKIAIVDDDSCMLLLIKEYMADAIDCSYVEVETFECAEDFLYEMTSGKEFDILLTDICLPNMSGLELGKKVRERQPEMCLVFLTSYSEYAAESYSIDANQYILKNSMRERLWPVLNRLIEERNTESNDYRSVFITENNVSVKRIIYYSEIILVSKIKASKYVEYITVNGRYRERITLDNLKKELPEHEFIMVDRSYIVNIRHIIKMSKRIIYLKGNHQVNVSRTYYADVKQQIHDYGRRR